MDIEWSRVEKFFPFYVFDPKTKSARGEEVRMDDFLALSTLLSQCKPKNILEIGSWTGSCTCLFGEYAKERRGKVHSIDNFQGSPGSGQGRFKQIAKRRFFENIKNFGLGDTVVFHEGYSDDFADLDMEFDFIFIDADHRYSQVKKDIDNYYPKLRPGGIMAGHDFDDPRYDERYIEDDFVEQRHHGVIKAVKERFPKVCLFTLQEGDKQRIVSTVWHTFKKEPCLVAI